ncbi:hypothetical protein CAOG_01095 [Capsaspora owczarzaki ATCC 30864]|uniref:Phorbol-ester/DAG-type domain-containing protein n=1 Tax=Capsaspora owczarzaki (strain ATCC 30864) TaxID=595528 RepID=A0A0D2WIJ8_CAPO3|nr:hypothetical protein CAOG_01095 [Capsaspora owczarzaki ATCC 30864]KJE89660.1 hypothetical protein CAOG_001095 [Capsaspora owczarzaki ATCC 30864]|eukprot:XP_004365966.2 hypothetical protein CAOG_01095 [Capsaspora owczarzaki ATCC 30864]
MLFAVVLSFLCGVAAVLVAELALLRRWFVLSGEQLTTSTAAPHDATSSLNHSQTNRNSSSSSHSGSGSHNADAYAARLAQVAAAPLPVPAQSTRAISKPGSNSTHHSSPPPPKSVKAVYPAPKSTAGSLPSVKSQLRDFEAAFAWKAADIVAAATHLTTEAAQNHSHQERMHKKLGKRLGTTTTTTMDDAAALLELLDDFPIAPQTGQRLVYAAMSTDANNCRWFNLLAAFMFRHLRDAKNLRQYFLRQMRRQMAAFLRSDARKVVEGIRLRDYAFGSSLPCFSNAQVTTLVTDPGAERLDLCFDLDYVGGFRFTVDMDLKLGFTAAVSIAVQRLAGPIRVSVGDAPRAHWSVAFVEDPVIELDIASTVEGREIPQLVRDRIVNQFRRVIRRKHLLPNFKMRKFHVYRSKQTREEAESRLDAQQLRDRERMRRRKRRRLQRDKVVDVTLEDNRTVRVRPTTGQVISPSDASSSDSDKDQYSTDSQPSDGIDNLSSDSSSSSSEEEDDGAVVVRGASQLADNPLDSIMLDEPVADLGLLVLRFDQILWLHAKHAASSSMSSVSQLTSRLSQWLLDNIHPAGAGLSRASGMHDLAGGGGQVPSVYALVYLDDGIECRDNHHVNCIQATPPVPLMDHTEWSSTPSGSPQERGVDASLSDTAHNRLIFRVSSRHRNLHIVLCCSSPLLRDSYLEALDAPQVLPLMAGLSGVNPGAINLLNRYHNVCIGMVSISVQDLILQMSTGESPFRCTYRLPLAAGSETQQQQATLRNEREKRLARLRTGTEPEKPDDAASKSGSSSATPKGASTPHGPPSVGGSSTNLSGMGGGTIPPTGANLSASRVKNAGSASLSGSFAALHQPAAHPSNLLAEAFSSRQASHSSALRQVSNASITHLLPWSFLSTRTADSFDLSMDLVIAFERALPLPGDAIALSAFSESHAPFLESVFAAEQTTRARHLVRPASFALDRQLLAGGGGGGGGAGGIARPASPTGSIGSTSVSSHGGSIGGGSTSNLNLVVGPNTGPSNASNGSVFISGIVVADKVATDKWHRFVLQTFPVAPYCRFCSGKVWRMEAFRCELCKYVCHKKCLHNCLRQTLCLGIDALGALSDNVSVRSASGALSPSGQTSPYSLDGLSGRGSPAPSEYRAHDDDDLALPVADVASLLGEAAVPRLVVLTEGQEIEAKRVAMAEGKLLFNELPVRERAARLHELMSVIQLEIDLENESRDEVTRLLNEIDNFDTFSEPSMTESASESLDVADANDDDVDRASVSSSGSTTETTKTPQQLAAQYRRSLSRSDEHLHLLTLKMIRCCSALNECGEEVDLAPRK